jgi:hypothetical protein
VQISSNVRILAPLHLAYKRFPTPTLQWKRLPVYTTVKTPPVLYSTELIAGSHTTGRNKKENLQ